MFKIFNKKKVEPYAPVTLENPYGYPPEVLEIHNKFDMAGDEILKEAYNIIHETDGKILEKANILAKFGFTKTPEYTLAIEMNEKNNLSKETIKNIESYRKAYPNYKFITEDIVERICKKYNLVFGDVSRYKGFVPLKNLNEIEKFHNSFKVDEHILLCMQAHNYNIGDNYLHKIPEAFILEDAYIGKRHSNDDYEHVFKKGNTLKYAFQRSTNEGWFYASDRHDLFGLKKYGDIRFRVEDNSKLKICAPIKDMDVEGLKLNGYKLEQHLPDPVILQRVKGGYLIVTKWGDEANDPDLSVEIHN